MAKTVVFDFDGVIHSYTSGWLGETTIPDPPVPGIREALKEIHGAGYEVVVVSTRCATAKGKGAIEAWLYNNGLREYIDKVCKEKPPAIAYIDDRAICFDGHPENLLKKIQSFEPWYKIPTLTPPNEWVEALEAINNAAVAYMEGGPYENDLPGMEFAVEIDRLSRDFVRPPNEPLTLEQLREMDGEPVWVEDVEHWALIDIEKGGQWDGMPFAIWNENGVRFCYNVINRKLLCYRRPTEGEV